MELLSAGVLILEMTNLRDIAPGGYTLICLPVGGLQPFRP
jgi:kynurenine formamidase